MNKEIKIDVLMVYKPKFKAYKEMNYSMKT